MVDFFAGLYEPSMVIYGILIHHISLSDYYLQESSSQLKTSISMLYLSQPETKNMLSAILSTVFTNRIIQWNCLPYL